MKASCKNVTYLLVIRHTFPAARLPTNIGQTVRRLRTELGMTQAELATRSGVARETIGRIEALMRPARADTILRLASVLCAGHGIDDLSSLVPGWPEADPRIAIGTGALSRKRRRELGLTMAHVAELTGVSEATISRLERNTNDTTSLFKTVECPSGDLCMTARNDRLAKALHFGTATEFHNYCDPD